MMKSFNRSAHGAGVAGVAAAAFLAAAAGAQWTVTRLAPDLYGSRAEGISGNLQVGTAWDFRGFTGAAAWAGSADARVRLGCQCMYSAAHGVRDGEVVGYGELSARAATLWTGPALTAVVLHPESADASEAFGVEGGQQVGQVRWYRTEESHASLWSGSVESWVDLNPAGCTRSAAEDVSAGQQVGNALIGGQWHASLWSGSAASWVDLNPAGATSSTASCVEAGVQGGTAQIGGVSHAGMWRGTAASWVDFTPPDATSSSMWRMFGGRQLGYVEIDGVVHYGLWSGTPDSWEELVLPAPPGAWEAIGPSDFWTDGVTLYVVGSGESQDRPLHERSSEALLWSLPVQRAADFNADGFVDFFDYDAFVACYEGRPCPEGRTADFNADGFVDFADYSEFVAAFEAGA